MSQPDLPDMKSRSGEAVKSRARCLNFTGNELERQWYPRQTRAHLRRRSTFCAPGYAFTCLECLDISPETVVTAGLNLLFDS